MEISKILTADVLDIVFEGRNKDYGAYELRRSYSKRLLMSISVIFLFMGLLYGGMVLAGKNSNDDISFAKVIRDVELEKFKQPEKEPEVLPPPPKQEAAPVKTEKLVDQIRIVPDDQPVDPIPPVDDLVNAKIGDIKRDGPLDDGLTPPPSDAKGSGIIVEPKREVDDDQTVFVKVEQESEYPGGQMAWKRFLERNLRYPMEAIEQGVQGRMVVQFIVDIEGNVSDIEVVEGPKELQAEAARVIKKSGKWTPAVQNGRKVKSYKRQPITFQLPQE